MLLCSVVVYIVAYNTTTLQHYKMGGRVTRGSRAHCALCSVAAQLRTGSISGRLMCSGRSRHPLLWRGSVRGRVPGIAGRSFAHVGGCSWRKPALRLQKVHAFGAGVHHAADRDGGTRTSAAHRLRLRRASATGGEMLCKVYSLYILYSLCI